MNLTDGVFGIRNGVISASEKLQNSPEKIYFNELN